MSCSRTQHSDSGEARSCGLSPQVKHSTTEPLCSSYIIRHMVNVLKFSTLFFLFPNKMLVIKAVIHKMLVRLANREDSDQTASLEAV